MKDFNHKLALVVGGSSGIGLEIAKQLAAAGANVWIIARRLELLQSALAEIQKNCVRTDQHFGCLSGDVSDGNNIYEVLDHFLSSVGTPDLLFNAFGLSQPGFILEQNVEVFHKLIQTNYLGTVHVVKRIAPEMVKRQSGHIINFSSVAGFVGVIGYGGYGASKYAIAGFSDVLRVELKPHHIKVSVAYPPDTDTPGYQEDLHTIPAITRQLSADNNKLFSPEYIAKSILNGVKKDQIAITPGSESAMQWFLVHTVGNLQYFVMDQLIAASQRKLDRKNAH